MGGLDRTSLHAGDAEDVSSFRTARSMDPHRSVERTSFPITQALNGRITHPGGPCGASRKPGMRDRARLAGNMARPGVVLPDFSTCHTLLSVFSPAKGNTKADKLVVRVDFLTRGAVTNNVRTSSCVERHNPVAGAVRADVRRSGMTPGRDAHPRTVHAPEGPPSTGTATRRSRRRRDHRVQSWPVKVAVAAKEGTHVCERLPEPISAGRDPRLKAQPGKTLVRPHQSPLGSLQCTTKLWTKLCFVTINIDCCALL